MKTTWILALLALCAATAHATSQKEDHLILDSKIYTIAWPESPFMLEPYLEKHNLRLHGDMSTANYNGHYAIWMVRDKKLYLIGLDSEMPDNPMPGVKDLPGAKNGELFADWFSGTLKLDYGLALFSGRKSSKRIKATFQNGVLVTVEKPPASAPKPPEPKAKP